MTPLNVATERARPYFPSVISRISLVLLAAVVGVDAAAAQTSSTAERSVATGAYSENQATKGEADFRSFCASCHTVADHTDDKFKMNWLGRTVFDLFKTLKTTMPDDNIGGLTDDQYTRVVAYILKINGFPAGADSLKADSTEMAKLRIGTAANGAATKPPGFR
jgi:S-disulfanyl-L-cysteine oxidoreductase SoxD